MYSNAGEMRLVSLNGEALGLNELGDVVGSQHDIGGPPFPFHDGAEGTHYLNPFGVFAPLALGTASGVNESRQAVGAASDGQARHAFLLQLPATDGALDLHPEGAQASSAVAINDLGDVVGVVTTNGETHGVVWHPAGGQMQMEDLDLTLGQDFTPSALNNVGEMVGDTLVSGRRRAARLANGSLTDLGALGGISSTATGVNEAGQIVGYAVSADGTMRAFVWTGGAMYDLSQCLVGAPGTALLQATAINDAGSIVAWGVTETSPGYSVVRGFVLTPATPAAIIGGLIDVVERLVDDGTLNGGQGNSLIKKLEQALATLGAGDTKKAVTMLEAFIHEVRAFKNAGILDPAQADELIATAEAVIASISG